MFAIWVGNIRVGTCTWFSNAVQEAAYQARKAGKPGAWITHPYTDRSAFVAAEPGSPPSDNLSLFNPKL